MLIVASRGVTSMFYCPLLTMFHASLCFLPYAGCATRMYALFFVCYPQPSESFLPPGQPVTK